MNPLPFSYYMADKTFKANAKMYTFTFRKIFSIHYKTGVGFELKGGYLFHLLFISLI